MLADQISDVPCYANNDDGRATADVRKALDHVGGQTLRLRRSEALEFIDDDHEILAQTADGRDHTICIDLVLRQSLRQRSDSRLGFPREAGSLPTLSHRQLPKDVPPERCKRIRRVCRISDHDPLWKDGGED